ncbi:MAG: hypothetical protein WDZ74_02620 [Candidatus Paceibacterota bacterium]|jgi:hypothetical protein
MQRIPTIYGFSIIILVFVLMILNHFIYLAILEKSYALEGAEGGSLAEVIPQRVNN